MNTIVMENVFLRTTSAAQLELTTVNTPNNASTTVVQMELTTVNTLNNARNTVAQLDKPTVKS